MYRDSAGRFGTIPHVCSYEAVDEQRQVISNILLAPQEGDIEECYWPIFYRTPPKKPDIRTLRFTVFSVEGKSLVKATSPRQLFRSWTHSLLGMFAGSLGDPQLICPCCRMVVNIPIWPSAQGPQSRKHPHDRRTREDEEV